MVEVRQTKLVGDPEKLFAAIYANHRDDVWLYCRRRVGADRVDDAVADVFLAVWRRLDDAPGEGSSLPWLYRICYLTISNHWRSLSRSSRLQRRAAALGIEPQPGIDDQVVQRQALRVVVDLLDELTPKEAEVLKLSAWEGLGPGEIAEVVGISHEAARQRLSRARRRLIDLYTKQQGGRS